MDARQKRELDHYLTTDPRDTGRDTEEDRYQALMEARDWIRAMSDEERPVGADRVLAQIEDALGPTGEAEPAMYHGIPTGKILTLHQLRQYLHIRPGLRRSETLLMSKHYGRMNRPPDDDDFVELQDEDIRNLEEDLRELDENGIVNNDFHEWAPFQIWLL